FERRARAETHRRAAPQHQQRHVPHERTRRVLGQSRPRIRERKRKRTTVATLQEPLRLLLLSSRTAHCRTGFLGLEVSRLRQAGHASQYRRPLLLRWLRQGTRALRRVRRVSEHEAKEGEPMTRYRLRGILKR